MTGGAGHTVQLPHRAATAHGSDQSVTDEEDSAGVHISRSGAVSRESSREEYTEGSEEEYPEEDTWTNVSKDIGRSEAESRPSSSTHHRLAHRPIRGGHQEEEEQEGIRLAHRPRQTIRRHQTTSPDSLDSSEEQYAGPAVDLTLRQAAGPYAYTPQQSVQGQPYAAYPLPPGYAQYQQPGIPQQHIMSYGQRHQPQYSFPPYQPQHLQAGGQYPFPPQARIAPGYGHEMGYPSAAASPYNPYVPYQIPSPIGLAQPLQYHYQPVYTPPPANPTPPVAAAAAVASDLDAYEDFKKMLLADKADRDAREAAAKKAQEEKLAAAEDAKKRAEDLAKAAADAAAEATTEAEKKAAAEQKKLKDEADEAAAKAKADAEAAQKKFDEEKEAAVKAAAAAASVPAEKQKPIKFKDAVGRKFSFPFHLCKTWEGMEELIRQAFLHVDVIGPHVVEGHYDLIGPNSEIILPGVWDTVIEPDWTVTMHMWPMPEKEEGDEVIDVLVVPDPPPDDKKKSKKTKKSGFRLFGTAPAKSKGKAKGSASAAAVAAAAAIAKK